jgi:hypothetical protein
MTDVVTTRAFTSFTRLLRRGLLNPRSVSSFGSMAAASVALLFLAISRSPHRRSGGSCQWRLARLCGPAATRFFAIGLYRQERIIIPALASGALTGCIGQSHANRPRMARIRLRVEPALLVDLRLAHEQSVTNSVQRAATNSPSTDGGVEMSAGCARIDLCATRQRR